MLFYYIFTRTYPFRGSNTFFILDRIREGEVDYDLIENEDLVMLLREMLEKKPEQRVSI